MFSNSECIVGRAAPLCGLALPLFSTQATRALELHAAAALPAHSLMQRAGLALAQLTLAVAPHAKTVWIACGPGNNGGDGFEAAMHLQGRGKRTVVSCLDHNGNLPADAALSRTRALNAGVLISTDAPAQFDACIDALFGIGTLRPLEGVYAQWVSRMNHSGVPVIAADLPTGLHADTGVAAALHVQASHTLSLLTLKPGLFTANGRDACGEIWLNALGIAAPADANACANLNPAPARAVRLHNSHKGSYGDVAIVGGDAGMAGAALLAGTAALHGGAGRVFVAGPGNAPPLSVDATQPELMFRPFSTLAINQMVVVAGCGGGEAMAQHLESVLQQSARLVLDADALNVLALEPRFQALLQARPAGSSVLTPHPLEAARLLHTSTQAVQADRLEAAQNLAERFACTVVLKGSGSVIAAPGRKPHINTTGNARLATAGTGDVLAGLLGALLATQPNVFNAACAAVHWHGLRADQWPATLRLTASGLARAL